MAVKLEVRNAVGVITPTCALDASVAPSIKAEVVAWWDRQPLLRHVVVDLEAVDFIDSAGLGILIGLVKRAGERAGEVRLVRPQASVRLILDITRVNRIFGIFETLDAALL